jgi:quercetin dioxygenase-like cupin family protein
MSISFRKIQWIVAGAALVLVGALAAGTWFRADSAQLGDQQKLVRTEKLPNVPGKSITAIVVSYPPGGKSGPHHHPGSVVAYVLSGAIRSENSATGPVKVYKAGESFFEPPGSRHLVSENASAKEPASLLAVWVLLGARSNARRYRFQIATSDSTGGRSHSTNLSFD